MLQTGDGKKAVQRLWSDSSTSFGTSLLLWTVDHYGSEARTWDPVTLWHEITDDVGVIPPPSVFDRFLAAASIITTDRFWTSLPDFIQICNVLSGSGFDPEEFDPADALESAWGLTEALLLDPPERSQSVDRVLAPEIRRYLAHVCREEGLLYPPGVLKLSGVTPEESANTLYQYADDPALFAAVHQAAADRSRELSDALEDRLRALVTQMESLTLEYGDVTRVAQLLRAIFSDHEPNSDDFAPDLS